MFSEQIRGCSVRINSHFDRDLRKGGAHRPSFNFESLRRNHFKLSTSKTALVQIEPTCHLLSPSTLYYKSLFYAHKFNLNAAFHYIIGLFLDNYIYM